MDLPSTRQQANTDAADTEPLACEINGANLQFTRWQQDTDSTEAEQRTENMAQQLTQTIGQLDDNKILIEYESRICVSQRCREIRLISLRFLRFHRV